MKRIRISTIIIRTALVLSVTLLMLMLAAGGAAYAILCGPSQNARATLVRYMKDASSISFIPDIFLPQELITEILNSKNAAPESEISDTETAPPLISAVKMAASGDEGDDAAVSSDSDIEGNGDIYNSICEENGIELIEVAGKAYWGIMMIVKDPARVFLGTPAAYGGRGLTLAGMIEKYDAIGGINGGGFEDSTGHGTGGFPTGIVISNGVLMWGSESTSSYVMGFDADSVFHSGYMSGKKALDMGLKWACSYGPTYIIDGEPVQIDAAQARKIHPRTAIGQRADGAVIMLVIEGRQAASLGATLTDVTRIMMEQGAVNAANLDGGNSAEIIYNGDKFNLHFSVRHSRALPNTFLIRK